MNIRSLLPKNNLTKLTFLSFFTLLYFYSPVMTLFLQDKGLSLWQVNSLWAIILISSFFAEIPTGIIADRIGRKNSIVLAILFQFIAEFLFIFFQSYPALIFFAILAGIGFAFSSGALEAFLFDDLKANNQEDRMTWAMGRLSAGGRAGNIVSFLIGGLLATVLTVANFRIMVILTAASVGIGLLFALSLDESNQNQDDDADDEPSSFALIKSGWQQLTSSTLIGGLVLIFIFSNAFSDYNLNLYQPYFVTSRVPSLWLGWGPALGALVGIFVATNAWRLKQAAGPYRAFLISILLPALFYFGMAWRAEPIWAIAMIVGFVASIQLTGPIFSEIINLQIKSESRATVLSLVNMGSTVYESSMGFVIGIAADRALSQAFNLMGGVLLIVFIAAGAAIWLNRGRSSE